MDELVEDLIDVLIKHKAVDESSLRNFKIRKRYKYLRENTGISGKSARKQIAEEFNMGEKNVEHILYGKSK
ncbi:MAG: hypothetical protein RDU14_17605 [Melioribacteraceae bacterium]|nr:hypothetical protein [Melioribacteraceae bacterium]